MKSVYLVASCLAAVVALSSCTDQKKNEPAGTTAGTTSEMKGEGSTTANPGATDSNGMVTSMKPQEPAQAAQPQAPTEAPGMENAVPANDVANAGTAKAGTASGTTQGAPAQTASGAAVEGTSNNTGVAPSKNKPMKSSSGKTSKKGEVQGDRAGTSDDLHGGGQQQGHAQ